VGEAAAPKRIDCHVHYIASRFADHVLGVFLKMDPVVSLVARRPAWRDLDTHRELMAASGVTTSVILQHGNDLMNALRALGGDLNETTEAYNRSMSEDLAPTKGQFVANAIVDPFGGKAAIAQLDRSLSLPGLVAIGLSASYGGINLDDPVFEPVFEVARHHDVPILVHPSVAKEWVQALRLDNQFLRSGLGFFLDDALVLLRMCTSGTFDKFPDVRFMFAQLGGVAPFCCGRWRFHRRQTAYLENVLGIPIPAWAGKALEDYLGHVWLDFHTHDRHAAELVIAEAGDHTIVLAGDHPYTPVEDGLPYQLAELAALDLPNLSRRRIDRENALKLIGSRASALP
jgi:predicted TIM-barrel fold metal-dependent hydrolase